MTKKSPADILIAYWEKEYIADKELQKRYDGYMQATERHRIQVGKLAVDINTLQKDMESLKDLIVDNACAGQICKGINDEYLHIVESYNTVVKDWQNNKAELDKNIKHIEQLRNISDHKKLVMYNMLKALEPKKYNIKPEGIGYSEWSEKYKDNIV